MLLTDFDDDRNAIINPERLIEKIESMPKIAVSCYSITSFNLMISDLNTIPIAFSSTANGRTVIYKADFNGVELALFMNNVGAPSSVSLLEDVYAMGVEKIILFGTCGVLDKSIGDCSIIIPTSAFRDEGTSYHYQPASDEIRVNANYVDVLSDLAKKNKLDYRIGKVWTTDAIYRETYAKMQKRKENGCICVDMECSANQAIADFRGKEVIQFFHAADNLDCHEWEPRSLLNVSSLEKKKQIIDYVLELSCIV